MRSLRVSYNAKFEGFVQCEVWLVHNIPCGFWRFARGSQHASCLDDSILFRSAPPWLLICDKNKLLLECDLDSSFVQNGFIFCRAVNLSVQDFSFAVQGYVRFLDYGGYATVEKDDFRVIDEKFLEFPFQGVQARLAGKSMLGWNRRNVWKNLQTYSSA